MSLDREHNDLRATKPEVDTVNAIEGITKITQLSWTPISIICTQ